MAKISKIMDANVPTLKKEAKVSDAAKLMADRPQGCIVIIEGKKPRNNHRIRYSKELSI